eukprot:jgi/Hompol1/5865/HPOL_004742-RA
MGGGAGGAAAEEEFAEDPNAPQNPFWLAAKLALVVFLLCRDASTSRTITLSLVALVVFFAQMGYIQIIWNLLFRARPAGVAPAVPDAHAHVRNLDNNAADAQEQPQPQPQAQPQPQPHAPASTLQQLSLIALSFVTSMFPDAAAAAVHQ